MLAEQCLALALQLDLTANHRDAVARHSGNLALAYLRQGLWQQVDRWIQPAIVLGRQLNDLAHLAEYLTTAAQLAHHEHKWSLADNLLHECLSLLKQQPRPDILLPATILRLECQVQQHIIDVKTGIEKLRTLLQEWPAAKDQALLYDAIWKLQPELVKAGRQAAQLYVEEHSKFPHVLYRQRVQALSGQALNAPAVPQPPIPLAPLPDLNELNQQLSTMI
jgi:hypothetical protein